MAGQDRTLPIELDRILDKDRRPKRKLWAEFDKEHAEMLGAAFDALSATLRTYVAYVSRSDRKAIESL